MDLINPFESVSKATPFLPTSSTRLRALVKTGAHLGHGQDLKVVRRSGGGGRKAGLEHYSKSVARGLQMVSRQAAPTAIPKTGKTASRVQRANHMMDSTDRRIGFGTRGDERNRMVGRLRGKLDFGSNSSNGRRIS